MGYELTFEILSNYKRQFALFFFNMGRSQPLFGFIFPFSWYIVSLQLTIFSMVNDDRKQERRRKSMHRSITRY